MKTKTVIYVHGLGGAASESDRLGVLFPGCDVIGFDYRAQTPIEAADEFPAYFDKLSENRGPVILAANSIGAYYSMISLTKKQVEKAFFISPVVDMEALVRRIMTVNGITDRELQEKKEITVGSGQTLSWDYFEYVKDHPVKWDVPTEILYGENDALVPRDEIAVFSVKTGSGLTVMKNGEHWFHTSAQLSFLDSWIRSKTK